MSKGSPESCRLQTNRVFSGRVTTTLWTTSLRNTSRSGGGPLQPSNSNVALGIFVGVGMHYGIDAPLAHLTSAGVDLTGMIMVRRSPAKGQRRLAARISRFSGTEVHLSETDDDRVVAAEDVKLEGLEGKFHPLPDDAPWSGKAVSWQVPVLGRQRRDRHLSRSEAVGSRSKGSRYN
ncbi:MULTISPECIES: hypothetical protein [unclassified Bradyrhizobium]|uniref:hypothetical protein n=1 Tax=unclassified Bradyrhizobium TaxID=2631580 RepID=UPI0024799B18|nr:MULTISPECIES: hypothetical protein [unclassified Bradyrhizobium]WGR75368.1 hypothetical protein MTX24_08300 [Bradyrhizobium sp. ISRA426]WGR82995.1 hypothetical protein MTX21_33255 [Bradyrhizobium sp. ISRA430]WGR90572.1 hypothetical protein MTX25_08305 [Bradyrhizobium sp. ISRA432]